MQKKPADEEIKISFTYADNTTDLQEIIEKSFYLFIKQEITKQQK